MLAIFAEKTVNHSNVRIKSCQTFHTCNALAVLLKAARRSAGELVAGVLVGDDPVPPMSRDHCQMGQSYNHISIRLDPMTLTKSIGYEMSSYHDGNMLRLQIKWLIWKPTGARIR